MKRENYRKIWEETHNCKIPLDSNGRKYDIHHLDGNKANNHPDNLKAVTIEEHLRIHKKQKDWGAVHAILIRMDSTSEEKSMYASLAAKERVRKGTHNWQNRDPKEHSAVSRMAGLKTKELGVGVHAINKDAELRFKFSSSGGKKCKELAKGIHDPNNLSGFKTRNTIWWTNTKTGKRLRRKESPGNDWIKGMKNE